MSVAERFETGDFGPGGEGAVNNLAELVRVAADRDPDRPALIFRQTTLTWRQLDERIDRAAALFRGRLGLAPGDRLAVAVPNGLDFPIAYFGALRAGLTVLPANPSYTVFELTSVLADSGAKALVTTAALVDQLAERSAELPELTHRIVAGAEFGAMLDGETDQRWPDEVTEPEQIAVLIYTSGTSTNPKGAMLSHRALLANLRQCAAIEPSVLDSSDVVLLVLPMFHVFGLNPGLGMVAYVGSTAVIVERFDPVDTLATITEQGVTNVLGAPPMYVAWSLMPDFAETFASVRLAISGAAPLDVDAHRRLLATTGRHVFEGYGLTEAAPVVTSTLLSEVPKPGSIGRPVPGLELRLTDPTGGAADADEDDEFDEQMSPGADEPGEIVVRGPNLFSGYWPDGRGGPDEDGWWATGDVAYRDDDGDLFLVDRITELILVSGFNVYPREIEDVLLAHPDIAQAAVIGIPHPYTGQGVKAYVVLTPEGHLTVEDVEAHCAQRLARFKCPSTVEFATALPHSATGKVSKTRLRAEDA